MADLTRKEIIKKIRTKSNGVEDKGQTKSELLIKARALGAISENEFECSSPKKFRVIKCYLWTLLQDPAMREQFDEYVVLYSKLWCRAHYIMNLLCHEMVGIPFARPQEVNEENLWWAPRKAFAKPSATTYLYDNIFGSSSTSNMFLRQVFFPEYFPTQFTSLDTNIKQCMTEHGQLLSHLAPNNWKGLMKRSGWEHSIGDASSTMKTTIDLYIRRSVVRCSKEYVKLLQPDMKKDLFTLLDKPWPVKVPDGVTNEVKGQIKLIRDVIGMDDESYLPTFARSSTEDLLALHLHFAKLGLLKRPMMPIAPLGRKHAFLDSRVARYLFSIEPPPTTSHNHQILHSIGLSLETLQESCNTKRKQLRKTQQGKARKIRRKWKKRGKFKKPNNGIVTSILSDGVGLSLRYSIPLDIQAIQEEKERNKKRKQDKKTSQDMKIEQMRKEDNGVEPSFVGIDGGRAKLLCASTQKKRDSKPCVFTYSRKHYYWKIAHSRRQKEEQQKVENNVELRSAREAMSKAGKEHNLVSYLQVQNEHSGVLVREAIESKFYSFRKMNAFRLRKSALAKACNALIDFGEERGRRLVLGVGDAGFASTHKGEKAAPTKSIMKSLNEVIKTREMHQKGNQQRSISSLTINEFRTTLICSSCSSVTIQPIVQKPNGGVYRSSRMRLCKKCDPINGKLRDRDVQASRNILKLTYLEYYGFPRPPELSRQKKSSQSRR